MLFGTCGGGPSMVWPAQKRAQSKRGTFWRRSCNGNANDVCTAQLGRSKVSTYNRWGTGDPPHISRDFARCQTLMIHVCNYRSVVFVHQHMSAPQIWPWEKHHIQLEYVHVKLTLGCWPCGLLCWLFVPLSTQPANDESIVTTLHITSKPIPTCSEEIIVWGCKVLVSESPSCAACQ